MPMDCINVVVELHRRR